jgi:ubiquinone/menaquinone biosynthesis C-methylase UbiE
VPGLTVGWAKTAALCDRAAPLDWHAVLGEFRRVLKPDGAVVFSTHHPAMDWQLHTPEDYFAVEQVTETWTKGSAQFQVSFWRRPLTAMAEAIASAGFVIERLAESAPLASMEGPATLVMTMSARSAS